MTCILDNRVAVHALIASIISPNQGEGLFVLAVPDSARGYFWEVIEKEARQPLKAAARSVSRSQRRAHFRNGAELLVLGHDTNQLEGLCDVHGMVVYGAERDTESRLRRCMQEEPRGWILLA